jgi:hypothetical protein
LVDDEGREEINDLIGVKLEDIWKGGLCKCQSTILI